MEKRRVRVKVPATSANLGAGFDTLALACSLYSEIELELLQEKELFISVEGEGAEYIARDETNLVWRAVKKCLTKAQKRQEYLGAHLKITNRVPFARGLGSSATAIVGGLVSANFFLDEPFTKKELLDMATELEGHPDNVSAALYGGCTVSFRVDGKTEVISFVPKIPLKLIFAVPDFCLKTQDARKVMPEVVPLRDAVFNIGRASALVASLLTSSEEGLRDALADRLHQPYRAKLIRGMEDVFTSATMHGALGSVLSGAGPSILSFATEREEEIGRAMQEAFRLYHVEARIFILDVAHTGAVPL